MPRIEIEVRDSDSALLAEIAEREWRSEPQQASAFVEQALKAARQRTDKPQHVGRRGRANGVAALNP